jgi:hypothetical protein
MHPISGDFDGDGKTDLSLWDPIYWKNWNQTGPSWYSIKQNSSHIIWGLPWGGNEQIPIGSQLQ